MIDAFMSEWSEAARQWTPMALDATIKASIVLVAAAIICRLAYRASAATRHFIWLLAIVAISVLPLLSRVLPRWHVIPAGVAMPAALALQAHTEFPSAFGEPRPQPQETHVAIQRSPEATSATSSSAAQLVPLAAHRRSNPFRIANWTAWIFGVWSIGACVVFLRLGLGVAAIRRTIRRSNAIDDSVWSRLLRQCRGDLGVGRIVALHRLQHRGSPAVWSALSSTILLPRDADDWSVSRRRVVLRHELAHVVRRDCLTQILARAALAVHWFNPLAWYALRRMNVERERACDNLALGQERRSVVYAEHVLHIASGSGSSGGLTAAPAMARQTELEGRIVAILDEHCNRRAMNRATGAFVAAALFFATLPLAAMAFSPPPLQDAKAATDQNPEADPSRVDRLLAKLLHGNARTNRDAAGEIRQLGNDHPDVVSIVDALLDQLQHDDAALRRTAAQALGYTRNPRALQPLIDQLLDPAVKPRAAAAGALGQVGDPRAVDPLIALLGDDANLAREWAVRSLGTIGDPRGLDPVISMLPDNASNVREWAVRSLTRFEDPRSAKLLTEMLTDDSAAVREWVVRSVGSMDMPLKLGLLAPLLEDEHADVREWAARSLADSDDPMAVDALLPLLEDPKSDVREWAIRSLGDLGDPRAVDPLIGALGADDVGEVREWAVRSLGRIGDSRAVAPLIGTIGDANGDVHEWAIRSLGAIGDAAAIPTLAELLAGGVGKDREWAATALGRIGGPQAMQLLSDALSAADEGSELRATIEESIAAGERAAQTATDDPWIRIARSYITKYGLNEERTLRLARLSIRQRDKLLKRQWPAGRRQYVAERVEEIKQRRLIAGLDKMAARSKPRRDP